MQKAQLALTIYDEEGEDAMVLYLIYAKNYPQNPVWDHSMTCSLPDGSSIVVDNDENVPPETTMRYNFHWSAEDAPQAAQRPLRHSGRIEVPEPSQTALSWPHTDSIQLRILERAAEDAQARLGQENSQYDEKRDDTYLLSLMQRKAPSARAAVNQAIDNNSQPESIMDQLEALELEWVDDAIALMQEDDYAALVQMMVDELQS